MKTYTFAVIIIILTAFAAVAQTPPFVPPPTAMPTPRLDELRKRDIAAIENFSVAVKSAEIYCENLPQPGEAEPVVKLKLRVVFDQTFAEIKRVSTIFGSTFFDRFIETNAYHLMNLGKNSVVELTDPKPNMDLNFITFNLSADAAAFNRSGKYSLFFRGKVIAKEAVIESASLTSVPVSPVCAVIPTNFGKVAAIEPKKTDDLLDYARKNFQLDRDSPEVKLSFAVTGERPTNPFYSTTVVAEPFELKRLGLGGAYSIVPFYLNLEKQNTTDTDIDKLNFGAKMRHLIVFNDDGKYTTDRLKTSPFIGIRSEITLGLETTTKFKKPKLIGGFKVGVPIRVIQRRSLSLRVMPFGGFDLGYKLTEVSNLTTKNRLIARPSVGVEAYFTPLRSENQTPIEITFNYITRAFLRPEEIYKLDENRKKVLEGSTVNPKHYISFKTTFWKTRFIAPYFKYTYGRDISEYLLEDHKYTVGIDANFDWGKKP